MFGITDLATYTIGVIAVILLPGPNSMYCLTIAGQYGIKPACRAVADVLLGDSLLILATVLGAGALLKLYPALFHGIQLAGGLYLAYIGCNLLRGAVKKWQATRLRTLPDTPARQQPLAAPHAFKRALVLSLTNPKAILFLLSFFVQFVDPAYPRPALSFFVLALILQLVSLTYLTLLIHAGHGLTRVFKQHTRLAALGMGAIGFLFIGFAIKMWTA